MEFSNKLLPKTYLQQSQEILRSRNKQISLFLEQCRCPEEGWKDSVIETLLQELSAMDSNNFSGNCGIGEREARFISDLVARRHYRMGHGIGRSGNITEVQPKASGSSLLNKLTNAMVLSLLKENGAKSVKDCFIVPMATGMSLVLCLLSLRQDRSKAKYVLWPRIDQKSCFKCITTAGFEPIVIENTLEGDELRTDLSALEDRLKELAPENVAAILSTTSCFAPRAHDKLEEIAVLCKKYGVPHIVNNAYGLQSSKCMHLITQAHRVGRLDMFVQSTDKNLMVPVGGSIIAAFDEDILKNVGNFYPGRGSSSPSLDVFISLLSLGLAGYRKLLKERKEMFDYMKTELSKIATKHGERVLQTKNNSISLAMTLTSTGHNKREETTEIGSMLFSRLVSGTRVVSGVDTKTVSGHEFLGWGAHHDMYPVPYFTAAASIGIEKEDIDLFCKRLDKILTKVKGRETINKTVNMQKNDQI